MKHRVTFYSTVIALVLSLILSAVTIKAQTRIEDFANAVVTLSTGQTLRISVTNTLPPPATSDDGRKFKMLFAPTILDVDGQVIARSDEITLAPGEFHSFNFDRTDLPLAGEVGSGSLQLRVEIQRRFPPGGVRVVYSDVHGVVELIDNLTGQTLVRTQLRKDIDVTSSSDDYQVQPSLLGLANGQTLRASVAHPSRGGGGGLFRAHIFIDDASGNLIAESGELVIPSAEFRSFDLPRSALSLTGEPGTGRVQMAANIFLKFDPTISDSVSVTLELVDNSTGRTTALLLPAIQRIREVKTCSGCSSAPEE
jgi:hypothetical protein